MSGLGGRSWLARSIAGLGMQQINGYNVYLIGIALADLGTHLRPGAISLVSEAMPAVSNARQQLEQFVADARIALRGTKDRARNIMRLLDAVQSATPNTQIPHPDALVQEMFAFQYVFQTECARLPLYLVTEKRGWDMVMMTEYAEFTLSGMAWGALTPDETRDIQAAGRCFAFEVPTAGAFHLYRLLESFVLKYMPVFGVQLKDSDRNLGNYIKILVAHNVDTKITDMLTHIKDEYRNPAIHPGLFFDVDGAASQFALVQSVVHMIAIDLFERLGEDFVWPSETAKRHMAWVRARRTP